MKIDARLVETEEFDPDVTTFEMEAGALQPWMILLPADDEEDDQGAESPAEAGFAYVVADQPVAFLETVDGREQRWVNIALLAVDDVLAAAASSTVTIIYGAYPDDLQPLLDEDLYVDHNQLALARNGMCPKRVDDDQAGEPVYCGRPSDPESHYRLCPGDDQDRQDHSEVIASRQFEPIYGRHPQLQG